MAEDWRAVAEEALARLGEAEELGRVEQRQDCAEQLRTWASVLERGNIYSAPATALFADGLRIVADSWSPGCRMPDNDQRARVRRECADELRAELSDSRTIRFTTESVRSRLTALADRWATLETPESPPT